MDAVDLSGMTPLMYAVNNGHGGATGLLCDYGADVGVGCTVYGVLCAGACQNGGITLHIDETFNLPMGWRGV